jgi:3-polyprenyl-4-hydroxybenzoate decarboxylase
MYKDLRGFIKQVDDIGALRRINGADPKFELSGITEVAAGTAECPALLFDRIKDHVALQGDHRGGAAVRLEG